MRVLSFSLDNLILEQQSVVSQRMIDYGTLVDQYSVIVPAKFSGKEDLSDKVSVYGSGGNNKICQFFRTYFLAKKVFAERKFSVITVQDQYFLAFVAWLIARKFQTPWEMQIHGLEKFFGVRKLIAKFLIPRATVIRVVSERLRRRLVSEFGVDEGKILVVPIYSDFRFRISDFRLHNDKFVFLTVGRLVEIKNIGLQISVFKKLLEKNKNIELRIVGSGPEEKKLKEVAADCSEIKFICWQKDLDDIYKNADAFLLTSNYEGWGMVIVEAASFGLPIIMTDVGCAGELIRDDESGLIVPVGDEEKLFIAMKKIVDDKDLRTRLKAGAQAAIKKLPSKEETLKMYLENWKKAAGQVESRK